jgi:hypothetical protein
METNPDSGQIEIIGRYGIVILYTHDKASDILRTTRSVLSRRLYWQDEDYLSSMLFRELTRFEKSTESEGFGIGTKMYINASVMVTLDVPQQKIHIINFGGNTHQNMGFEEFISDFSAKAEL